MTEADRPRRRHRRRSSFSENVFDAVERSAPRAAAVRDDGAPADIAPELLDQDGLRVLNRLHRNGFEAYFVGGCVRDLLIGQRPKDFDISTSARPEEVRALFGNCRLIGRRFRLAHIFFRDGKIFEVSTFRAKPQPVELEAEGEADGGEDTDATAHPREDLLIVRDNVFGTSTEDALRRDLTINGLFYDVERGRVLDLVGSGLSDLKARLIRTIGDPEIRLREDPVRILRAIRFAARLDFEVEAATWRAMKAVVSELPRCAAPRLLEEIFKFLRSGMASPAFRTLHEVGVFGCMFSPIGRWLDSTSELARENFFAELSALDACVRKAPLDDAILLAALISPLVQSQDDGSLSREAEAFLEALAQSARLPRRISERVRKLFWAEAILTGRLRRKRSLRSFREHPEFAPGLKLLEIHAGATPDLREIFESWSSGAVPVQVQSPTPSKAKKPRRRRRGRAQNDEAAPDAAEPPASPAGPSATLPPRLQEETALEPGDALTASAAPSKLRHAGQLSFDFK
jgi:poly(A) polymerase